MNATERDTRVEAEIAAPLREAAPAIDDLRRARLESAIESALDEEDRDRRTRRRGAPHSARSRRRWPIVAVGAAAALSIWIAFRSHGRNAPAPLPPPIRAVAVVPPVNPPPALLRPYQEADRRGAAEAVAPATSIVALRGERARATIGARVRLTLVGAGRVSVLTAARDGDIELALDGGRLLVDYDGQAGGTLRVRSPGAITTVVGTLFAVEAMGSGSRVAVAHGRVRTEDLSGGSAQVAAGNGWTSADGRTAPIPDDLAAALAEHQAGWARRSTEPARSARGAGPFEVAEHPGRAPHPAAGPAPRADLDGLYVKAEAAMRERSLGEARRALETIATRDPRGPLGEAALLDLARLALADGDRAEARRALARLPRPVRDPALAETVAHLRCRARQPGGSDDESCDAPASAPPPR
jgi:ferric-dicitrate binding protein FerR (iron transport regulator)